MTVYLVQEAPNRNFLPAQEYGDIKILMPQNAQIFLSAAPALRRMNAVLSNFSDEDYILLSGDFVLAGLAIHIALSKNNGRAKLLKWDRRDSKYYVVEIDEKEKGEQFYAD